MGDRPCKRCRDKLAGLRADKRFRGVGPEDWTAKRSASVSLEKEPEGLQSSFSRIVVG